MLVLSWACCAHPFLSSGPGHSSQRKESRTSKVCEIQIERMRVKSRATVQSLVCHCISGCMVGCRKQPATRLAPSAGVQFWQCRVSISPNGETYSKQKTKQNFKKRKVKKDETRWILMEVKKKYNLDCLSTTIIFGRLTLLDIYEISCQSHTQDWPVLQGYTLRLMR